MTPRIPEWIERCAQSIADMPFRADSYEQDIAVMIATQLPRCHRQRKSPEEERLARQQYLVELRKKRAARNVCVRCGGAKEQSGKQMCNRDLEDDRRRHNTRAA